MMKRIEMATCYHCSALVDNREHVPPKCLFPKDGDWSKLTTVPSCSKHNNNTSVADEYLKFLLGASGSNIPISIRSSTARSVVRLAEMGSRNLGRYGIQWDNEALVIDDSFPLDIELLNTCLRKIARALYFHYHNHQRKLLSDLRVWPLFIPLDPGADTEFLSEVAQVRAWTTSDFDERPKHGPYQEIFTYQVIEESGIVAINMEFYGTHRAAVMGEVT